MPDAAAVQTQANIRAIAFSPTAITCCRACRTAPPAITGITRRPPNLGDRAGSKDRAARPARADRAQAAAERRMNFVSATPRQGRYAWFSARGDDRVANHDGTATPKPRRTHHPPGRSPEKSDEGTNDTEPPIKKESIAASCRSNLARWLDADLPLLGRITWLRVYDVSRAQAPASPLPDHGPVPARYSPSRDIALSRPAAISWLRIFDAETGDALAPCPLPACLDRGATGRAAPECRRWPNIKLTTRGEELRVAVFSLRDGQRLFTAGGDSSVILWGSRETGQKIRTLLAGTPADRLDRRGRPGSGDVDRYRQQRPLTARLGCADRPARYSRWRPARLTLLARHPIRPTATASPHSARTALPLRLWRPQAATAPSHIGAHNDWVRSAVCSRRCLAQRLVLGASADGSSGRSKGSPGSGLLRLSELRGHPEDG